MRCSTWGQIDAVGEPSGPGPAPSSPRSSTGTWIVSSHSLAVPCSRISTGTSPPRNCAATCVGRTVADSPTRGIRRPARWSSRARLTARCAPRLEPAMACTSSMITDSTPASMPRAAEVSMRNNDSGVVIRTSGGRRAMTRRSWAGVSPVRRATLMCGVGSPRSSHWVAMPASGERRLRSTSTASAFSGLTYSTRTPVSSRGVRHRSMAQRKAARVLPDPVGATARTFAPAWIRGQAAAWTSVGAAKAAVNHRLVGSENAASGSTRTILDPASDIGGATGGGAREPGRDGTIDRCGLRTSGSGWT